MTQGKDCTDLSVVSDEFTEEVLADVLSKAFSCERVQLLQWKLAGGFNKGDNYLSIVNKGKLYGTVNGEPEQVDFVVKSIPKNVGRRKTFRSVDFFRNEITFYSQVVPKFEKFLEEKKRRDMLRIPRYLASHLDGANDFIVLEDASSVGFGPTSRQNCLDWTEFTVIIELLAKFHAISFAYKDQRAKEFAELTSCLEETYFSEHNWDWYQKFHKKLLDIAKHALATEYPNSKAERRFNSYKFGTLFNKCVQLCGRGHAPTSVVCEGDCWGPNFLVRDIGQDQKEALMLDFQLARCANPVLDLSHLIYSCTLKPFRDQYYNNILKMYYHALSDGIKSLGSDPEKIYPLDLFMREVKDHSIFGLVFSLEAIYFGLLDQSQQCDLDVIKGDEAVNIADMFTLSKIETPSGRQRLADVIVHAVENGYL